MDFVSELVRKRGKENLQKFIQFIVEIFKRYIFIFTIFCICYKFLSDVMLFDSFHAGMMNHQ